MTSTACCSGSTHPGEPKGVTGTLHGLPTYIAEPPNGAKIKGIVVMLPDLFGWEFVNLRLLCDTFAERIGVRCLLPDFMAGHAAHPSALLNIKIATDKNASWFTRLISLIKGLWVAAPAAYHNRFSVCWPRIESFFISLRESTDLPIGATGYCWGGKYAMILAHGTSTSSDGKPLIDAAFTAHPSQLVIPAEIEKVQLPVLLAHGTEDIGLSNGDLKAIQDIFRKKNSEVNGVTQGRKYEISIIDGARHGFAVRGDPDDKAELEYGQIAEDQAVEWFKRWLVEKR